MSRRNRKYGMCHICGVNTLLSYEHVPPESAFNNRKMYISKGVDLIGRTKPHWDDPEIKKRQYQRGFGEYTLCERCNNDTGGWYGRQFSSFVHKGFKNFLGKPLLGNQRLTISFHEIQPLAVIKQIVTMIFSTNNELFHQCHPDLVAFVKNPNRRGINPNKYGIYLYILVGEIGRHAGLTGIHDLYKSEQYLLSEIAHPPFGYIFECNPKKRAQYCDLTFFANQFHLENKYTLRLDVPVLESNTMFPGDHRNKGEILKTGETPDSYMYLAHDNYCVYSKLNQLK